MAERPDLEYVVPILLRALRGRVVKEVRVTKPVVLRTTLPDGVARHLVGRAVRGVRRRGHFVIFELVAGVGAATAAGERIEVVVAPMLAGRFALCAGSDRVRADVALALALDDGRELRYRDDVQMGKVYVLPAGAWDVVPGLRELGVDVLDPEAFTAEAFRALARTRRDQLKVFLMDKRALDALGNAYADEVLFDAGLHPKTFVRALDDAELERLRQSVVRVLLAAREELAARRPPLDEKLRDFLKVRNRAGEPCPRCGTRIRKAGVHGHDAFFCPACQPPSRKSGIVDWRALDLARNGRGDRQG
jgi:formamidopyrimidine-DNA glycosylase